jgi:hypothetical protein
MDPQYRDGSLAVDGRSPYVVESIMAGAVEYEKTGHVYAIVAPRAGTIYTPEGVMSFEAGDMIVSDIPPTHAWPVKRAVFDRTYRRFP